MKWESKVLEQLGWCGEISNREAKERVAEQIADRVQDGDTIGVGSGSTVYIALFAIAEKVKREKLQIKAIPTSQEIIMTCNQLGIPLTTMMKEKPDWLFDGADEVDPDNNLIKGRGGAMFKEKLLMSASKRNYIIVDDSKMVDRLGKKFPIPIEIFPQSLLYVEQELHTLGAETITLRLAKSKDGPIITENGNFILDTKFKHIDNNLERKIKLITGVIESGLFIGYNIEPLVATM